MSRRRLRRRAQKERRHAPPGAESPVVVREATRVERLAYSRTQAAEALAISRIETIEMPWGTRLIPVDELERLVAEWRRPARKRAEATTRGRPPLVAPELIRWIHAERAAGKSLRQIADGLNASGTPTAHGGRQWWPSTIRAVLQQ